MEIQGSCYCGQVKFTAVSHTPYPYMRCYCSMCRKTAGGGGYSINIMAQADTFKVEGEEHVAVHDVGPMTMSTRANSRRALDKATTVSTAVVPFGPLIRLGHNGFTRMHRLSIANCRDLLSWFTLCSISPRRGCSYPKGKDTAISSDIPMRVSRIGTGAMACISRERSRCGCLARCAYNRLSRSR